MAQYSSTTTWQFFHISHNYRHPMAQPWGWDMGCLLWVQGPFHKRYFHCNSNSMKISFCSHLLPNKVIATKFCIYVTTAMPLWYVAILWPLIELQQCKCLVEFQLWAKVVSETGSWPTIFLSFVIILFSEILFSAGAQYRVSNIS